ncbi:MAG TPA: ATP-binding cassette domain-containing protein [Roseiarcus sp.]|nr:ATP-binding cassette domain-containing protein [Roseiarcus sp.]
MTEPLIELRNVSKHFAGVRALTDVWIAVHPGEVVCPLGDNGAGKSTLIKILSGFHPLSSGLIYLDGQETRFADPRDARSRGIATVHQEVGTIPRMNVGRNFFLGAELKKVSRRSAGSTPNDAIASRSSRYGSSASPGCVMAISWSALCPAASVRLSQSAERCISARKC